MWQQLQSMILVGVLEEFMQELGMRLCELRGVAWDRKRATGMLDELLANAETRRVRAKGAN